MAKSKLQGALLLAAPVLRDPNFDHSVLYVAAHTVSDGAFGYILNRPLDKTVRDIIPTAQLSRLADVPVFAGGPVSPDKLAFASFSWKKRGLVCQTHLTVEDAVEEHESGGTVRAFIGYSGWSQGQLERELEKHAWVVTPPPQLLLDDEDTTDGSLLWTRIMTSLGPVHELIADMCDEPLHN
jgi:putative transcriptional regulator